MFETMSEVIEKNRVIKYSMTRDGVPLTYGSVLQLWAIDTEFRDFFTSLLVDCGFTAFRWESPPISSTTILRLCDFVVVNSPEFNTRRTDAISFKSFFGSDHNGDGIVTFENLGGDATLIVPTPETDKRAYGHLGDFIRLAPKNQVHALWRIIGETLGAQLGEKPIWLSTAGGSVAWLHVRLDSTPKYYCYSPFRVFRHW